MRKAFVINLYEQEISCYFMAEHFEQGDPLPTYAMPVSAHVPGIDAHEDDIISNHLRAVPCDSEKCYFLENRQGYQMLQRMVATGRCYEQKSRKQPLTWGQPIQAEAVWNKTKGKLHTGFETKQPCSIILPLIPPVYINRETGQCGDILCNLPDFSASRWAEGKQHDAMSAAQFITRLQQRDPGSSFPLPPTSKIKRITGRPIIELVLPGGSDLFGALQELRPLTGNCCPYFQIFFSYNGKEARACSGEQIIPTKSGNVLRDEPAEKKQLALLADLDIALDPQSALRKHWRYSGDWRTLVKEGFAQLKDAGWKLRLPGALRIQEVPDNAWYGSVSSAKKDEWFQCEFGVESQKKRINVLPILLELLNGLEHKGDQLELLEKHGGKALALSVPPDQLLLLSGDRICHIAQQLFELYGSKPLNNDRLRVNSWRAAEIEASMEVPTQLSGSKISWVKGLAQILKAGKAVTACPPPTDFIGELRPYQELGLGWLSFLAEHRLGGLLADDMGLGKTVQVAALLLEKKTMGQMLVVAPTSLLGNWKREIKRFAPTLTTRIIHGNKRLENPIELEQSDILITSYACLRQDSHWHVEKKYAGVVLDEAQYIKNPQSQAAHAVRLLQAEFRIALSGTPLENHLGELWSLFQFLLPGFLGSQTEFNRQFRKPIEQVGRVALRQALHRRIKPFMLRRSKEVVASELPPRSIIDEYLDLSRAQKDLYESCRLTQLELIENELQRVGLDRSRMIVLTALLRLRQVCCDPRLVDSESPYKPSDSAKLEWLREQLPTLIKDGRRILLFSQFVSMLDLIETELNQLNIDSLRLTGATTNRDEIVDGFQAGKAPILLLSLKAGGVGLNLTAADTVILFDPWWNPATEAQAMDRAYRIGQDKPVFVYRLIAQDSVEERIQKMQASKRDLAEALLQEDTAPDKSMKITQETIQELFT